MKTKPKTATIVVMVSHDPLCDQCHGALDKEDAPSLVADVALNEIHKVGMADVGFVNHVSPSLRMSELQQHEG